MQKPQIRATKTSIKAPSKGTDDDDSDISVKRGSPSPSSRGSARKRKTVGFSIT